MKLREITSVIGARILCGEELASTDVRSVIASDMMSDVLRFSRHGALLVTGNSNIQSVRTALIAELAGIVFVRNKVPDPKTIEVAKENGIFVAVTQMDTFEVCGLIYQKIGKAACQDAHYEQLGRA